MTQRQLVRVAIVVMMVVIGMRVTLLLLTPPPATEAVLPEATADALRDSDVLGQFATISGDNLDGQTLTFPADFTAAYNLVVMPFNRDQQASAIQWLPTFEAIAKRHPQVAYYSIAALDDLSPLVRTLVIQGLNLAVSDAATRQRTVVAFLANQNDFVTALGNPDRSQLRVLLVTRAGAVLHEYSGTFSETAGFQFQSAADQLITP